MNWNKRIFWTSSVYGAGDGWYYWLFRNWITGQKEIIHAGYTRRDWISRKSAWERVKEKL